MIGTWLFPVSSRRDDGHRAEASDLGYDLRRVVTLVGDHGFGLLAVQQADRP